MCASLQTTNNSVRTKTRTHTYGATETSLKVQTLLLRRWYR